MSAVIYVCFENVNFADFDILSNYIGSQQTCGRAASATPLTEKMEIFIYLHARKCKYFFQTQTTWYSFFFFFFVPPLFTFFYLFFVAVRSFAFATFGWPFLVVADTGDATALIV